MQAIDALMPTATATFIHLLRQRFAANVFTTEDSVRYTFFAALLHHGIMPEQVVLEAPYQSILGAKLDTLVHCTPSSPQLALEFKYTRALRAGGGAVPRPMLAGKIFADLGRLLLWPDPAARYFIHVTGRELYNYLTVPHIHGAFGRSLLAPIFTTLRPGSPSHDIDATSFVGLPDTFYKDMGLWPGPATLTVIAREALPQEHHLWVLKVEHKR